MKWLTSISLAIGIVWLIALTVLTVRIIVDAPWTEDPGEETRSVLCKDALERRQMTEAALSRDAAGGRFPLREVSSYAGEVRELNRILDEIELDIGRFCGLPVE